MTEESVLITGVSSGTGLGLASKFLQEGFRVIGSVRSQEKAADLQSRFGEYFTPLVFDITEPDQVVSAARELHQDMGVENLAAIINNAGWAKIGPLLHVPIDDFRAELDVLVVGQLAVIQNFYRFLLRSDGQGKAGRIFNITSVSGVGHNVLFGGYAAGKHALEGLTKTLRKECEMYGIGVVAVAPGNIATAIWDKQTEQIAEQYRDTDYFELLSRKISSLETDVVKKAMTVEEFSVAFYSVYTDSDPSERYTIVKKKNKKNPFSKLEVRVLRS